MQSSISNNNDRRQVLTIPLHASNDRRQNALVGQLEHHKNRRLAHNQARKLQQSNRQLRGNDSNEQEDNLLQHHPSLWREAYTNTVGNQQLHRQLNNALITDVALSNCHLVLYSGMITLGSPPTLQHFRVDFDTAGSDLWVPSRLCDSTCAQVHPSWNFYDPSISSTYELATEDLAKNQFALEYQDGEAVSKQKQLVCIVLLLMFVFVHLIYILLFPATNRSEENTPRIRSAWATMGFAFPTRYLRTLHTSKTLPPVRKRRAFWDWPMP